MHSLIKLQIATIYSQRAGFAVAAFCDFILILAMSFAGWLDSPQSMLYAVWIQLGLCYGVTACLLILGEKRRGELFCAQHRLSNYLKAELVVFILICGVFALLWCAWMGLTGMQLNEVMVVFGIMLMTTIISGHAVFCNLMPRLIHLPDQKRIALILLTAAPWILPTWILGIISADSYLQGNFYWQPLLGMISLGLIQMAFGALYHTDSKRPDQSKDQDKHQP